MSELTRAEMMADLTCLLGYLSSAHPDPYRAAGGPVPFYRLAARIAEELPARADRNTFLRRLRPLVALVQDGHTTIRGPADPSNPRRLWLDFGIVEQTLYVRQVYELKHRPLLGARIRAVGGEAIPAVSARVRATVGSDNALDVLLRLIGAFQDPALAAAVFGERALEPVAFELERVDGRVETVAVPWSEAPPGPPLAPASRLPRPALGPGRMGWGFLDPEGRVACIRFAELMRYREAAETWRHSGYRRGLDDWYREENGRPPEPGEVDSFIASRPSATDLLVAMMNAIEAQKTPWVIVDASECPGGTSTFAYILAWFLFGEEAVVQLDEGYQIPRYSTLYEDNYGQIPDPAALACGGYDFRHENAWRQRRYGAADAKAREDEWREWLASVPTFERVAMSETLPRPRPRVIVVTGAETYSAGFDVAVVLRKLGATHVGVPSAQAPNCFIDGLAYTLPHSGLTGTISFKESFWFPEEALFDRILTPHVVLTYDAAKRYGFDPAAGVRLAIDAVVKAP